MHTHGRIPLLSARVQPMAFLCSLNTLNSFSSSIEDTEEDIMIVNVDEGPRYAYLKCFGNGFSSILGGFSTEGISQFELSPNYSKYLFFFYNYRKNSSMKHTFVLMHHLIMLGLPI